MSAVDSPIDFHALVDSSINKPARYMGHELGVESRDWSKATVRWALTYPVIYEVGSCNLGHIILYSILNAIPGQLCDRAHPSAGDLAERLRVREQALAVDVDRCRRSTSWASASATNSAPPTSREPTSAGCPSTPRIGDRPLSDPESPPLISPAAHGHQQPRALCRVFRFHRPR